MLMSSALHPGTLWAARASALEARQPRFWFWFGMRQGIREWMQANTGGHWCHRKTSTRRLQVCQLTVKVCFVSSTHLMHTLQNFQNLDILIQHFRYPLVCSRVQCQNPCPASLTGSTSIHPAMKTSLPEQCGQRALVECAAMRILEPLKHSF